MQSWGWLAELGRTKSSRMPLVLPVGVNQSVPKLCAEWRSGRPPRAKTRAPPMLLLGILIGVWIGVPMGVVIIGMLGPREGDVTDTSGLHARLAQR